MESDVLLYALGREANVDQLRIENANITISKQGYIPVNALFQTSQSHIYAAGDVIGGPCLASTSMEQARLAIRHAFGAETHHFPAVYPICIWTIPEISCCGLTEEQLIELGFNYEVGRAYYYEIARSHIDGSKVGLCKLLFHSETLEILGAHVFGKGANEVIHIAQVAMNNRCKIDYFIDQVFNYPSYAEGFRIAALNGINKVGHRR
jgi:NAD(P) transhydrogenase